MDLDNAAFGDSAEERAAETHRILSALAFDPLALEALLNRSPKLLLRDSNGNRVGRVALLGLNDAPVDFEAKP